VAKTYVVTFRLKLDGKQPADHKAYVYSIFLSGDEVMSVKTGDDRRPSKFIVLADGMKSAINKAWEHGGTDFQSRFDKATGQAQEMKEGALRVL
jgi:hypothetical protein